MNDQQELEFFPRMRMAGLSAGVMLVLFCVLAALNLDKGIIRMLVIFTIGAIIAACFAAPYLLRRKPSMSIDGAGITLIPTFARRVYIPWKCLASARTAIRAKHHLRLEVDWTKLSGEDTDPTGASLPHPRSAPLELHGLRRIDLDANVHEVLLILQQYKDRAAA
jgi:hypothetical protein